MSKLLHFMLGLGMTFYSGRRYVVSQSLFRCSNGGHQLLEEIKRSRKTFDNSDSEKNFGAVVIQYGQVQSNVNNKYDFWHKDVLKRFSVKLAEAMKAFHVRFCDCGQSDFAHKADKHLARSPFRRRALNLSIIPLRQTRRLRRWHSLSGCKISKNRLAYVVGIPCAN
jgi:hypothetical protein